MILMTERLILRPFCAEDASLLHQLHSDPKVMKFIPAELKSLDDCYSDIQEDIEHQLLYGFSKWAVFLKENHQFIGRAGWAKMIDSDEAEVGFKFLPEYWQQGFATEVLTALIQWAKKNISFSLIAFAFPENAASIRVLEKAGMSFLRVDNYEGYDIVVYSI